MDEAPIIPLMTIVKDPGGFHWIVAAVTFTGGERYYMLHSPDSDVALMPAVDVETWERV